MKKCREYRIRVSSFPATYTPLICMKLTILPPLCLSFQPILSSSSSSSIVHVRLESKPPPSLPTSRPRFLFVLGGRKQKEGGVKKCGRKGFPLAAALESRAALRPHDKAGYTCGRLPYLLRPSNKPQTSSRGKGWRGKEYSREIPSLVNGWGKESFARISFSMELQAAIRRGEEKGVHVRSCTGARLFFSVTITWEREGKDRRVKVNLGPLPRSDRDPGTIDFSPEIYPENEISGLPSLRPSCIYSLSNR